MPGMPWVKIYTEMLDDPKMGRLTDSTKWLFVSLVLLAGECDAEGYLVKGSEPLAVADVAWRLRMPEDTLCAGLEILQDAGLIACEDGCWLVCRFSERQGRPQEEKRALWRERKRRQRQQEGEDEGNDTGESRENGQDCPPGVTRDTRGNHGGVTPLEKEGEGETERESPSGSRGDHHANAPPSVAQLQSELSQVLADLDDEDRNPTAVLVDWFARVSGRPPPKDAYKRVGGMLGNVFSNGRRGKQKAWRIPYREACRQAARLAIEARQGNPEGSFVSYLEEVLKEKWSEEQPIDPDRYQQEFGDLLDRDDDWSPPAPILPEGVTKFTAVVGGGT